MSVRLPVVFSVLMAVAAPVARAQLKAAATVEYQSGGLASTWLSPLSSNILTLNATLTTGLALSTSNNAHLQSIDISTYATNSWAYSSAVALNSTVVLLQQLLNVTNYVLASNMQLVTSNALINADLAAMNSTLITMQATNAAMLAVDMAIQNISNQSLTVGQSAVSAQDATTTLLDDLVVSSRSNGLSLSVSDPATLAAVNSLAAAINAVEQASLSVGRRLGAATMSISYPDPGAPLDNTTTTTTTASTTVTTLLPPNTTAAFDCSLCLPLACCNLCPGPSCTGTCLSCNSSGCCGGKMTEKLTLLLQPKDQHAAGYAAVLRGTFPGSSPDVGRAKRVEQKSVVKLNTGKGRSPRGGP